MSPTTRPTVAIDVTPLIGPRSGVGVATAEIIAAFGALEAGPELVPYTLSARARRHRDGPPGGHTIRPDTGTRAAGLLGADGTLPRIDRWLRPARVLHATNYLTPPSALPSVVSIYDCSFVRYPELCTPEVQAFEPIVRRAIRRGATVHTGSEFVGDEIEEIFGGRLRAAGRLLVIPLGVPALGDTSTLPADIAAQLDGAPFVLAIGTLEPRKNFPHLVGAFGELAARHDGLRLVIAGHDGPARPAVDAAVARARRPPPGPVSSWPVV